MAILLLVRVHILGYIWPNPQPVASKNPHLRVTDLHSQAISISNLPVLSHLQIENPLRRAAPLLS